MNGKRLYRCRQDRQIAGVAGGMAEYFGVDPTVIRILWILSVFLGGFTLLLYLIMAIVVPLEPLGWTGPNGAWTAPNAGFAGMNPAGPNPAGPNPAAAGETSAAGAAAATGAMGAAGAAPGSTEGATGWAAPGAQPHWTQGQGWTAGPAWVPGPAHTREPRNGSFSLVFGVLLVVFGSLALLGPVFPGWIAGIHLWPAFLVALGVAFLVVAFRRPAAERPIADRPAADNRD